MIVKKLLLAAEIILGVFLILIYLSQGKETAIESAFGIDLEVAHGMIMVGLFYVIKAVFNMFLEAFDPSAEIT